MQASTLRLAAIFAGLAVIGWFVWAFFNPSPESNPIVDGGAETVNVLPFSEITNFVDPPLGWEHTQFWMIQPMMLANVEKDGNQALRCETKSSASILSRTTEIEIGDYPTLVWDWLIDIPVSSPIDEATEEGDDHPARILLSMTDQDGGKYDLELIWSNRKYEPGDYKYIGEIPHYVVNGFDENTKIWHHQEVDLMEIYREISGRDDYPVLNKIGIFCDSDNTSTRSVAFFSEVMLQAR